MCIHNRHGRCYRLVARDYPSNVKGTAKMYAEFEYPSLRLGTTCGVHFVCGLFSHCSSTAKYECCGEIANGLPTTMPLACLPACCILPPPGNTPESFSPRDQCKCSYSPPLCRNGRLPLEGSGHPETNATNPLFRLFFSRTCMLFLRIRRCHPLASPQLLLCVSSSSPFSREAAPGPRRIGVPQGQAARREPDGVDRLIPPMCKRLGLDRLTTFLTRGARSCLM